MNIIVVGLNHNKASVEVREKFAFDSEKLPNALKHLKESKISAENVILSTCNRVEMYASVKNLDTDVEKIIHFLSDFHNVPQQALDDSLVIYQGPEAVRHIFRVASGLDSVVLGEPQILGQLKDAYGISLQHKSTSTLLNRLMKKTFSVAKRTRTETGIGKGAVNISFAAVELAKKIFEDLSGKSFMLMGAGEMAELAARHLIGNGVEDVTITNRTLARAEELAQEFGGKVIPFENFMEELLHLDIAICSTGAPNYILRKEQLHTIMKERKQKPMFIFDISVPRNIDPEINDLDNVYLYDVDDLKDVADANAEERGREADKAEKIVEAEVQSFLKWQNSLVATPTIVAIREKAEEIRKEELDKTLRKLGPLEEDKIKAIEYLSSSIMNKLIHPPTAALKSVEEDREIMIDMANRLFKLETEENNGKKK
ncbi:MAG: glutamyl-tRNA reductase [Nitrospira bacterium SG8_35_1]|nr:MAG: glutamyl-tRNA reductase [Nitrospira bacterium SG8_35_1]